MLKNSFIQSTDTLVTEGFMIAVEVEDGTSVGHMKNKLADALTWVEGVGKVDVDYMGRISVYNETKELDAK